MTCGVMSVRSTDRDAEGGWTGRSPSESRGRRPHRGPRSRHPSSRTPAHERTRAGESRRESRRASLRKHAVGAIARHIAGPCTRCLPLRWRVLKVLPFARAPAHARGVWASMESDFGSLLKDAGFCTGVQGTSDLFKPPRSLRSSYIPGLLYGIPRMFNPWAHWFY